MKIKLKVEVYKKSMLEKRKSVAKREKNDENHFMPKEYFEL